ncbi:MAG: helix-turn-helix domain-containing protein [Candidatus Marinimicrobia bacterium]|nr:helix-turn-helix domain-containing protein [Candidatus Neomarinimicrobiota bacterium]
MEKLYSLKTAAEMLDISIRTLRRIIENEEIQVYQVGTRLRLSESQVKSMIKPQKPAKTVVDEILNV